MSDQRLDDLLMDYAEGMREALLEAEAHAEKAEAALARALDGLKTVEAVGDRKAVLTARETLAALNQENSDA